MFLFRTVLPVRFCLAALFCLGSGRAFPAQDPAEPSPRLQLLQQIRDSSAPHLILDDLDVVSADVRRMLNDLGFGEFSEFAVGSLKPDRAMAIDSSAGMVQTQFYPVEQCCFRIRDVDLFEQFAARSAVRPEGAAYFEWADGGPRPAFGLFGLGSTLQNGVRDGNTLLLFSPFDSRGGNEEHAAGWLKSGQQDLLWPELDEPTRQIVLQSGLSVVTGADPEMLDRELGIGGFGEEFSTEQSPAEQAWLKDLAGVVRASDRQVVGIKYHPRVFELRARAQISAGQSFDQLVRPESAAADWKPALGLEREQLVLAAAIQMNAFSSSAASRVVPRVALLSAGRVQTFEWLHGNMLRTLTELMGDSWNDLDAARVAFYQNREPDRFGQFSIVGAVDARDPDAVLRELERMSRLTSPEAASLKGLERDEEIARLLELLVDPDPNVAARAESRLVLAGRAAIPALERARQSWNDVQRESADRILRRIAGPAGERDPQRAVADPGFWTELNPGLRLETSTGRTGGFETHTVHVTADPSKNAEDVAAATRMMVGLFGSDWNRIRVVQVRNHFVFLNGSDLALLERTVANLDAGRQLLGTGLDGVGNCSRNGQLQLWVNGQRLRDSFFPGNLLLTLGDREMPRTDQPAWLALEIHGSGAEAKALVPIEHLVPVLFGITQ